MAVVTQLASTEAIARVPELEVSRPIAVGVELWIQNPPVCRIPRLPLVMSSRTLLLRCTSLRVRRALTLLVLPAVVGWKK